MSDNRIDRESWLIEIAYTVAERSTCSRKNVGAVIARESRIIATGYNGAPSGLPHCNHSLDELMILGCERVVHAESNAIAFAARYGVSTEGTDMYITLSPCVTCAKLIINSGIRRVYYANQYRDLSGVEYLSDSGIEVNWYEH